MDDDPGGHYHFLVYTNNPPLAEHLGEAMAQHFNEVLVVPHRSRIIVNDTDRESVDNFLEEWFYRNSMMESQRLKIRIIEIY